MKEELWYAFFKGLEDRLNVLMERVDNMDNKLRQLEAEQKCYKK